MFSLIMDGTFATLSPSAKAILYVVENVKNHQTNELFHRVKLLAKYAGIYEDNAFDALKELESLGIITREHRHGKSSIFHWTPTAKKTVTPTAKKTVTPTAKKTAGTGVKYEDKPAEKQVSTEAISHLLNLTTDPNRQILTTTETDPIVDNSENVVVFDNSVQERKTAAAKISKELINEMRSSYGSNIVEDVLIALENFNGEIQNPGAYFRSCCKNGWIPSNKTVRDRHEKQVQDARAARYEEQRELEKQAKDEEFQRRLQDPETQAQLERYKKMLNY